MTFERVIDNVQNFGSLSETDRVALASWHLHQNCSQKTFTAKQVNECFDEAHLARPSNTGVFLANLVKQKRCARDQRGDYRLLRDERIKWAAIAGVRQNTVKVDAALASLSGALSQTQQQAFLDEVIACVGAGAFRSACVMAWNLAYDHLCMVIIKQSLGAFNSAAAVRFTKNPPAAVTQRTDFEDWKEFDVLRVARDASVLTKNQHAICEARLKRRNMLAHPSSITVSQLQAEEMIIDLVDNIIKQL